MGWPTSLLCGLIQFGFDCGLLFILVACYCFCALIIFGYLGCMCIVGGLVVLIVELHFMLCYDYIINLTSLLRTCLFTLNVGWVVFVLLCVFFGVWLVSLLVFVIEC